MASVRIEHVFKRFMLRKDRADSVGQLLVRMIPGRGRRPKSEDFWALKDISLDMPEGVSYGIIGSNGSGKSTLLKILTRTMAPTRGSIDVKGRVSALIELGAGFHPDFTGRENVYLNASILGIPRRSIEKRMDDIIDFADIRPFIDTPVKYYSSGMNARLGFSVATSVEPELLIVDEVLAVGDESFQQRCMDRIFRMKRQGTSILLVSHDLGSIERLMDRTLWIDKGVQKAEGKPRDVVFAYRQSLIGQREPGVDKPVENPSGTLALRETVVRPIDGTGDSIVTGTGMVVQLNIESQESQAFDAHVRMTIRRPDGLEISSLSTFLDNADKPIRIVPGVNRIELSISEIPLATGQYELDAALNRPEGRILAEWKPAAKFSVQSLERVPGLILLPHQWKVG